MKRGPKFRPDPWAKSIRQLQVAPNKPMTVAVSGFESSSVFTQIATGLEGNAADKETAMKKVKVLSVF